jgi:hypothetical protein
MSKIPTDTSTEDVEGVSITSSRLHIEPVVKPIPEKPIEPIQKTEGEDQEKLEQKFHCEVIQYLDNPQTRTGKLEDLHRPLGYAGMRMIAKETTELLIGAIQWGKLNKSLFDPKYFFKVLWDELPADYKRKRDDLWLLVQLMRVCEG